MPRVDSRLLRQALRTVIAAAILNLFGALVAIAIGILLHNGGASVVWNGWLGFPHVVNGAIEYWPQRGLIPEHPSDQITVVTVSRGDWGITRYGLYSSRAIAEQSRLAPPTDFRPQRVPWWARRRWMRPRPDILSVTGYGWPWPAVISWRSPKLLTAVGPTTPDEEEWAWPGAVDEYIDLVAMGGSRMTPFEAGRQRVLYWPGIASDAAVFGAGLLVLWVVTRGAVRAIIIRNRSRHGLCVVCGYARRGLPDADPCPECGHMLAAPPRHV